MKLISATYINNKSVSAGRATDTIFYIKQMNIIDDHRVESTVTIDKSKTPYLNTLESVLSEIRSVLKHTDEISINLQLSEHSMAKCLGSVLPEVFSIINGMDNPEHDAAEFVIMLYDEFCVLREDVLTHDILAKWIPSILGYTKGKNISVEYFKFHAMYSSSIPEYRYNAWVKSVAKCNNEKIEYHRLKREQFGDANALMFKCITRVEKIEDKLYNREPAEEIYKKRQRKIDERTKRFLLKEYKLESSTELETVISGAYLLRDKNLIKMDEQIGRFIHIANSRVDNTIKPELSAAFKRMAKILVSYSDDLGDYYMNITKES